MFDKRLRYVFLVVALLIFTTGNTHADLANMPQQVDDSSVASAAVGYRTVDTTDNASRASEYTFLDDSATFDLLYNHYHDHNQYSLLVDINNENDYFLEGDYNHKALLRLSLTTERMYHNLNHIPYDVTVPGARQDSNQSSYTDLDKDAVYGRRVTFDTVKLRGKLPTYPAHINLSYWRMERKGHEQLRFVGENCAQSCHMQSTTRNVNRVTEEIKAGFDAHLGPVDIAFLQTLRQMKEKANNPNDQFGDHDLGRVAGNYDHDVTPDSELSESTFTVNLPPSGGFVTSASYTIGKREKTSYITGVAPTGADTDYQKLAADVSYTPGENWTFNFRYRMFDLDSTVPATLTTNGSDRFDNGTLPVRDSIDINTDNYAAYISYRPIRKLTLKGEFERSVVKRSDTGEGDFNSYTATPDLVWDLPDEETTDRLRLSFYSRLFEKSALKFNGWYQHVDVDNPAYGTTLTNSDEVFFSASYKPSMYWGSTGSIDILNGNGSGRDKDNRNLALGLWVIPNQVVSADINYGYLDTNLDEEIDFGTGTYNIPANADYDQKVHTIAAGINIRPNDKLNFRLEGYHIRSTASFDPTFTNTTPNIATDDGLEAISKVDIRQNGIKTKVSWKLTENLTAGIEYTYDDYEERNSSTFDGSVQTVMANLSGGF